MDWPDCVLASNLFADFPQQATGLLPEFPNSQPVWAILGSESDYSLKSQLDSKLQELQQSGAARFDLAAVGATTDESAGPVWVEPTAVIEPGAHLIGPCYIGPQATVRHAAYVRPYTWACYKSVIGHCSEVKHSILLPNAKAPHFNYVGDSVLGQSVNLGAGTKISNLRNDGTEVHVRIEGQRIGSGLRKFGAVLGDECQLGCNSVTNPGVVLGKSSFVHPNATVTGVHDSHSRHS